MLVAAGRGVTVLADWVLRGVATKPDYVVKRITEGGLSKRMYAATRDEDLTRPYIAHMMRLARTEPVKLQKR